MGTHLRLLVRSLALSFGHAPHVDLLDDILLAILLARNKHGAAEAALAQHTVAPEALHGAGRREGVRLSGGPPLPRCRGAPVRPRAAPDAVLCRATAADGFHTGFMLCVGLRCHDGWR
jgi:hypothetical protein